jgi:hypothetical protein
MRAQLILLGLIGLLFCGCSRSVEKNQIPGIYTVGSLDTLELRPNGTYRHAYQNADGRSVTDEGAWQFEIVEDRPTVTLQNFRCTLPGVKSVGRGIFLMKATAKGKKVRLWLDEDQGIFYEQQ